LTREFGYVEVNSGKVLADLLKLSPVPATGREVFQARAWKFISRKDGPRRLAAALLHSIPSSGRAVLIDGIRQRATLEELKKMAAPKSVAVLYVYTPPNIAFQFYQERRKQLLSINEFLELCEAPVESEVKKLISAADAVLYNWNGKLRYEQAVRQLLRELQL
jgi:hypothetical protein